MKLSHDENVMAHEADLESFQSSNTKPGSLDQGKALDVRKKKEHALDRWKRTRSIAANRPASRAASVATKNERKSFFNDTLPAGRLDRASSDPIKHRDSVIVNINPRESPELMKELAHEIAIELQHEQENPADKPDDKPVVWCCGITQTCWIIMSIQLAVVVALTWLFFLFMWDSKEEVLSQYFKTRFIQKQDKNSYAKAKVEHWDEYFAPREERFKLLGEDAKVPEAFDESVMQKLDAWIEAYKADPGAPGADGMTIDPFTGEQPTSGTMVAIDGDTALYEFQDPKTVRKWIFEHRKVLCRNDRYLGAWISKVESEKQGKPVPVIELSVRIPDLDKARQLGFRFSQEGIFEITPDEDGGGKYHNTFGHDELKLSSRALINHDSDDGERFKNQEKANSDEK